MTPHKTGKKVTGSEEKQRQLVEQAWSGRRDLNPRQLAWEARTLPLSYARTVRILRWRP